MSFKYSRYMAFLIAAMSLSLANQTPAQPISDGTVAIEFSIFTVVPSRQDGSPARLNSVTFSNDRLFATESLEGVIYEITNGVTKIWLNVGNALGDEFNIDSLGEGGLRSVAFHPEFKINRKFYTSQMQDRPSDPQNYTYLSNPPLPQSRDSVVTEWTASTDESTFVAREVFRIGVPGPHVIKQIYFNPNATTDSEDYGYLYVTHGDGGPFTLPLGGQNNDALGKIIRVNPLQNGPDSFTVPINNPFLNDPSMLDEVFALGLRSPHNLSFTKNGAIIAADIGSGNVEEINIIQAGKDYGWKDREGTYVYVDETTGTGISPLPANDAANGYVYPAAQYLHDASYTGGIAIAGGHPVENDSALDGLYLYGEFATKGDVYYSNIAALLEATTSGDPTSLSHATTYRAPVLFDDDNNDVTPSIEKLSMLDIFNDSPMYTPGSNRADLRFGQGPDGEIYVTSKQNNTIYVAKNSRPPEIRTPARQSRFSSDTEIFSWTDNGSDVDFWWLYLGSTRGAYDYYNSGSLGSALSDTISDLPVDGTEVFARLWYRRNGESWNFRDSSYFAVQQTPEIVFPAQGSQTYGTTQSLAWSYAANDIVNWWVYGGTKVGGRQHLDSGSLANLRTYNLSNLPVDGSTLYVRLWYRYETGPWRHTDITYQTGSLNDAPVIQIPPPGSVLTSSSPVMSWAGNSSGANQWWIYAGSAVGKRDYFDSGDLGDATTTQLNSIAMTGNPVYVRLWFRKAGMAWSNRDFVFGSSP